MFQQLCVVVGPPVDLQNLHISSQVSAARTWVLQWTQEQIWRFIKIVELRNETCTCLFQRKTHSFSRAVVLQQPFGRTSCLASHTALFNIVEQILLSPTHTFLHQHALQHECRRCVLDLQVVRLLELCEKEGRLVLAKCSQVDWLQVCYLGASHLQVVYSYVDSLENDMNLWQVRSILLLKLS